LPPRSDRFWDPPNLQGIPNVLSAGITQPKHEANHSFPPSAKVKNMWNFTSTPRIILQGTVLN